MPGIVRLADLNDPRLYQPSVPKREIRLYAVPLHIELLQRALDPHPLQRPIEPLAPFRIVVAHHDGVGRARPRDTRDLNASRLEEAGRQETEIGRASCRE